MFRDYNDFYILRTDLTTGKVTDDLGRVYDLSLVENSNDLERRYQGGSFQANYRFGGGVEAGGNYTLSRTWGNFDGENPASGPLTAQLFSYPEYREAEWNQAEGNLGVDQRHRRASGGHTTCPWASPRVRSIIGVIVAHASGTPYTFGGAAATSPGTGIGQINPIPYVTNPGYATPVSRVEYYFFPRDEYRTEAQFRTDLSLNYEYTTGRQSQRVLPWRGVEPLQPVPALWLRGTRLQQRRWQRHPHHQQRGADGRQLGDAASRSTRLRQTPVQGVNWNLNPTFGTPANRFAYTSPRTFRFNLGVRF